jgi:hypothetical protein
MRRKELRAKFEVSYSPLLFSDYPLHKVANRNDSDHPLLFHTRKMTYSALGHNGHAVIDGILGSQALEQFYDQIDRAADSAGVAEGPPANRRS